MFKFTPMPLGACNPPLSSSLSNPKSPANRNP